MTVTKRASQATLLALGAWFAANAAYAEAEL
jgi:hypothetical protein